MYGADPARYNEIPDITNTNRKPKLKIYPDITNKCHYATEIESKIDKNPIVLGWKILYVSVNS